MPERVYLAADFARRSEICGYGIRTEQRGHTVTAQWLKKDTDSSKPGVTDEQRLLWATMEREDVRTSSVFILFTTGQLTRGGRQTEWGMAVAYGVPKLFIVGPQEHLFQCFATYRFDNFSELLRAGVL